MRNLFNAIHMTANHAKYFPHWPRLRYARMWEGFNPYEMLGCQYEPR